MADTAVQVELNGVSLGTLEVDGEDIGYTLKSGMYFAYITHNDSGNNNVLISTTGTLNWPVKSAVSASYAYALASGTVGSETKPVYFEYGEPKVCTDFLPLTAGENKKIQGELGLTTGKNYGNSLPSTGFEGQLFFLEEEEKPSLPTGGTEG